MSIPNKEQKVNSILLCVCLVTAFICLINPKGLASGSRDFDAYLELRTVLSEVKNAKPLFISSDDDYFDFKGTLEMRQRHSLDFALEGTNEVYSAASLGEWSFVRFLNQQHITHLIVPQRSSQENRIQRKWGSHGDILINLASPYLNKIHVTTGEFAVAVYVISKTEGFKLDMFEYKFVWGRSMRPDFYSNEYGINEVGLYSYEYQTKIRDNSMTEWVMADEYGIPERPSFVVQSSNSESSLIQLAIKFVSAYGSNAPVQVVSVSSENQTKSVIVSPGNPGIVELVARSGELIEFRNILPCRAANSFDLETSDTRFFCFGIAGITARLLKVG